VIPLQGNSPQGELSWVAEWASEVPLLSDGFTRNIVQEFWYRIRRQDMPMKWRKSSPKLIETFEGVAPGPPAVHREMFGYPAAFVNGNMFMGLFQEEMFLRLPQELRTKLAKTEGWKRFEPMPGRPMGEYMVVPESLLSREDNLRAWVAKALLYGESLKPKAKSKPKAKTTSKTK
jgi:TfoX/Sxy family transcriptional regulator of competence genes